MGQHGNVLLFSEFCLRRSCRIFSFFSFNSFAGDYKVDYAIDARGAAESEGPAECTYGRICRLEFKESHISIYLHVDTSTQYLRSNIPHTRISVTVYGQGNGCCYFDGADRTKYVYYDNGVYFNDRYVKLDIFEGRRRYGLELVGNIKIGTVFLMLKNVLL